MKRISRSGLFVHLRMKRQLVYSSVGGSAQNWRPLDGIQSVYAKELNREIDCVANQYRSILLTVAGLS